MNCQTVYPRLSKVLLEVAPHPEQQVNGKHVRLILFGQIDSIKEIPSLFN